MTSENSHHQSTDQKQDLLSQWLTKTLESPALDLLASGIKQYRSALDQYTQTAVGLFGLATHNDYRKITEVLSRSSRKLTAVEANLARIESLLADNRVPQAVAIPQSPESKPEPTPEVKVEQEIKVIQVTPVRKEARPIAKPVKATQVKKAVAPTPVKQKASPAKPSRIIGSDQLLEPLLARKKKLSSVTVKAGRAPVSAASSMLTGFDLKAKKKRKK